MKTTPTSPKAWSAIECDELDHASLTAVIEGRCAAIVVRNYFDPGRAALIVQAARRHGFTYYEGVFPPIGRIGRTQVEARDDKATYFETIDAAFSERAEILGNGPDPFDDVLESLDNAWSRGARVATEPEFHSEYFAGVLRDMGSARLHVDWARKDAPNWAIGKIKAQLSWNLFLEKTGSGGECVVYRKPWAPACEQFKTEGNYGYEPEVVAGVDRTVIDVDVGDLVIIDPRNFHEVLPVSVGAKRVTISSFIGVLDASETLLLWS